MAGTRVASRLPWCSLTLAAALATALLACASAAWAAAPEATPEQIKFFEEKVRPILAENCYKCHGSEAQKGNLRLDIREMALAGGESGPVIVPGKPEASVLVEAIKWQSFEMPPTGKLSSSQIDTLTEWIRLGAPMPAGHGAGGPEVRKTRGTITDEDRQWWAFQPIVRRPAPSVAGSGASLRNPIDAFLLAALSREGLAPAAEADRPTLLRRLMFDLIGLPPTTQELDEFCSDPQPDAYERLVDRLLADPRHGERWARHWLDLVRYAESDGYKQDAYRPNAYHYRDYVIRALNRDKPYSQFVLEQLAGDEVAPNDPEAVVATGYLRLGIYEYNQRDVRTQWANILYDVTDVTADVFLAMGMSCARCHDHKFDPILQKDYYRLQACFAPLFWRDDAPAAAPEQVAEYQRQLAAWEAKTADLRRQIDEIERPHREAAAAVAQKKFPVDLHEIFAKSDAERTPLEKQLTALAYRQLVGDEAKVDYSKKLKGETKERWEKLRAELSRFEAEKPAPIPTTPSVTDVGPEAPVVTIPGKRSDEPIEPGPPTVLESTSPTSWDRLAGGGAEAARRLSVAAYRGPDGSAPQTTGRRTALAEWIISADNPLPSRVLANRLWQHHFGRGLAEAPSDFGHLGQPPTHPELLDWLARELLDRGWSIKTLHRHMVTSAAYRRASTGPEASRAAQVDPANKWLARMTVRRLAAEQIRDAALAVTGELALRSGGPAEEWKGALCRSVYLKVVRNKQEPTLDVFDVPDGQFTTPVRNVTTTPMQSLYLINGPWMLARAKALAGRLERESSATLEERIVTAYGIALGRPPQEPELQAARQYLLDHPGQSQEALTDFCHVLLNSNEFLYVD